MNWFTRKSYPEFWEAYKSYFSKTQEQNIEQIRFVVFDTETTGLDTKNDRILSIDCVLANSDRLVEIELGVFELL